jgi:hypothetical protein
MWADIHSHLHPGASLGFSRDSTHSIQNDIDNMAWFPTVSFYVADALGNFHKSLNGNITAFGQSPFLFK